jgi:hypothetical protein
MDQLNFTDGPQTWKTLTVLPHCGSVWGVDTRLGPAAAAYTSRSQETIMLALHEDCICAIIDACDSTSLQHLASTCRYLNNLSRPRLCVEYMRKLHAVYLLAKRKHKRQLSKARRLGFAESRQYQAVLYVHPRRGLIPYRQEELRNELLRIRECARQARLRSLTPPPNVQPHDSRA